MSGRSAQVAGCRVDGNRAELERISDGVIGEEGEYICREIQHHQVRSVFLAHQTTGKQGESGLHEQDEISSVEGPGKVSRYANVTDAVGELYGQGLFCRLSLVLIKCFLIRRIVR